VPFWPYAYCFHLSRHKHVFVNASRLAPYEYRPEVRDKLVLPDHHRDLIEVLTESGAVLAEDIIEGKKGGTIILCRGLPGTGKTSTAEAYSEIVKRPLYRVHSGQLGTSAEGIEKQLELVLDRATRWNVILLIDEAETFVATRGNSVLQNAITGVFLRVLEYWDGLLFMTTNRSDDIDDAIISRCMAVITYSMPAESERRQIWTVLAKQFEVDISQPLIEELVRGFDKASGRDIKNLLRLTKRYVEARGLSYSLDVFRQCAQFRGM
jgi:SpoVK/Ycf46/Vps4 family AAA+-type ATPase